MDRLPTSCRSSGMLWSFCCRLLFGLTDEALIVMLADRSFPVALLGRNFYRTITFSRIKLFRNYYLDCDWGLPFMLDVVPRKRSRRKQKTFCSLKDDG